MHPLPAQIYIDAIAALNAQIVTEATISKAISNWDAKDSSVRLSSLLIDAGLITQETSHRVDEAGDRHKVVLQRLSSGSKSADPLESCDDYETLAEADNAQEEQATPDDTSGDSPSRYFKSSPHAKGGLGQVWLAQDAQLGRRVALKEIQPELADEPSFRKRFLREARITGTLEHPGVVPVYGLGAGEDGRPYYAMRFVEGDTLRDKIDELFAEPNPGYRNGNWVVGLRRLLNHFVDICNTINYAHSQGVIHRDLKPSNIMIGAYGETLVVDWGLAKQVRISGATEPEQSLPLSEGGDLVDAEAAMLTAHGTAVGTIAYMSPEQARSADTVHNAADIYSLGATLFHILSGNPPLGDSSESSKIEDIRRSASLTSVRDVRRDIPRPLASICSRSLEPNPKDRYASARELAEEIENWMANQPVAAHQESLPEKAARWVRTHPTTVGVMTVSSILTIAAVAAGLMLSNSYEVDLLERTNTQARIEASHVARVQAAVEAASASADVELKNSQYSAALEFLNRAIELAADEPELVSQTSALSQKRQRLEKLVGFYERFFEAERLTFDDHSRRSAVLFQNALLRLGVFDSLQWWTNLPDDELSSQQIHQLREDVYLGLYLLGALRLKETLPSEYNLQAFLELSGDNSEEAIAAADVIFDLMDAYRTSQGAKLGREFTHNRSEMLQQILQGFVLQRKAVDWKPANQTDSYIMGCALAFFCMTVGEVEQKAFQKVLGLANAEEASLSMLTQSGNMRPDHYVNQLMLAYSLWGHERYDEAFRRYTHAIALRKNYWSGYYWRGAMLLDQGVNHAEGEERTKIIRQSQRDLERAVDLAPHQWDTHKTLGDATAWTMEDVREVIPLYKRALELCQPVEDLRDLGVESAVQDELKSVRVWCQGVAAGDDNITSIMACNGWAAYLLGDPTEAIEFAKDELSRPEPDIALANLVLALAHYSQQDYKLAATFAQRISPEIPSYHASVLRGRLAMKDSRFDAAEEHFTTAKSLAVPQWQKLESQKGLLTLAIVRDESSAYARAVEAIAIDDTDDFRDIIDLCRELPSSQPRDAALGYLLEHSDSLEPIQSLARNVPPTEMPLLNGDFELGLTPVWGESLERIDQPAWSRQGGSLAVAVVQENAGNQILRIANRGPQRNGQRASLTQQLPVSPGVSLILQCRVAADDSSEAAVCIVIREAATGAEVCRLPIPEGSYSWKPLAAQFRSSETNVVLSIECTGATDCQIDDLEIIRASRGNEL